VRLIRAGEETGRLAGMLEHAARIEGVRAEATVRSAVRVIEPAMIIGFGAVVALVAASLLQAVYSVRP
jgi:general secretion pathway protein F